MRGAGAVAAATPGTRRATSPRGGRRLVGAAIASEKHNTKLAAHQSSTLRLARHGVVGVDDVPDVLAHVRDDLGQVPRVREHAVLRREDRVVVLQRGDLQPREGELGGDRRARRVVLVLRCGGRRRDLCYIPLRG